MQVQRYLSLNEDNDISWALIRGALSSVAKTAIVPMQDVLGLDNSARMNTPATQVCCIPAPPRSKTRKREWKKTKQNKQSSFGDSWMAGSFCYLLISEICLLTRFPCSFLQFLQFGNWSWRIPASASFESLDTEASKLRDLLSMYGRL